MATEEANPEMLQYLREHVAYERAMLGYTYARLHDTAPSIDWNVVFVEENGEGATYSGALKHLAVFAIRVEPNSRAIIEHDRIRSNSDGRISAEHTFRRAAAAHPFAVVVKQADADAVCVPDIYKAARRRRRGSHKHASGLSRTESAHSNQNRGDDEGKTHGSTPGSNERYFRLRRGKRQRHPNPCPGVYQNLRFPSRFRVFHMSCRPCENPAQA
jgi:hypothetical protein